MPGDGRGISRLQVPQQHCAILGAGRKGFPIARIGQGEDPLGVLFEGGNLSSGRHVPQYDRPVARTGGKGSSIGGERHHFHPPLVPRKDGDLLPTGHVPQPDRLVQRRGGDASSIRRKGHRFDPVRMPLQGGSLRSGRHVPQPDGPIVKSRHEHCPVGRKVHQSGTQFPFHFLHPPGGDLAQRRHLPQHDDLALRAGDQGGPIRRERHRGDPPVPSVKDADGCARCRFPQLDIAVAQPRRDGGAVGRDRHRIGRTARRQQRHGTGRGHLVNHHPDAAGHGEALPVRPEGHGPVALPQDPLSKAHGAGGQVPGPEVSPELDHGRAHPFRGKGRQLPPAQGDADGVGPRFGAQGQRALGAAAGIGGCFLDREAPAELAVTGSDREGDAGTGEGIAELIPHLYDKGLVQGGPGCGLLVVPGDDHHRGRAGTRSRPLGDVPKVDRAVPLPGGEEGSVR